MSDSHDDRAADLETPVSWQALPNSGRLDVVPPGAPNRDDAPFDLAAIASWLPRLGAVLWFNRNPRRTTPARASIGSRGVVLFDHPALAPLASSVAATAHTQVTTHGPREWLSFRDAGGVSLAKLFLLPDTDYLAWDEMISAMHLSPALSEPARWHAHSAFLRLAIARLGVHWQARLLTFDHRRLPWLQTLDARPPLRLSLLGLELARVIASSEGAELTWPLHAA